MSRLQKNDFKQSAQEIYLALDELNNLKDNLLEANPCVQIMNEKKNKKIKRILFAYV